MKIRFQGVFRPKGTANTADGDELRHNKMGFDDSAWKPSNQAKLIETIHQQSVGAEPVPAAVKM